MFDLIVFDLDGTLVDSRRDLASAVNALIEELGGRLLPEAAIGDMVGEGAGVLVRRALTAAGLDAGHPGALGRFLELYDHRLLDHTRPYPGMPEILDSLATVRPLAVLTNKPAAATERILEAFDLRRHFRWVIGGDSPLGRKPDPAGLVHLAAGAGTSASRTLLVGDSGIDLDTARRAGSGICLCRYGFGYRFEATDFHGDELFIDEPGALPLLLGR
jgi:phosphoglycolate phosphatase